MKFSTGRSEHFHIGLEIYNNSYHSDDHEFGEYSGICLAFGFWHVDIEWPKRRTKGGKP